MTIVLNQFWECPKCGTQWACGPPGKMVPPVCQGGHDPTEMEQVLAERFAEGLKGLNDADD